MENVLVELINKDLELSFPPAIAENLLREKLSMLINELIVSDFQRLIFLLYKVDINESKLKRTLRDHPGENAGMLIADMVIEREEQKLKSRKESKQENPDDSEERW
jgi:hypothetical protein